MTLAPPIAHTSTSLPSQDEFAEAFFTEAVRHLQDARVLHRKNRFAAAITSSAKAAEFAIKAALLLEGAAGFLDKLFTSHKPLTETENHPLFSRVKILLESGRPGVAKDVTHLESLSPKAFGTGANKQDETNTEYPYLTRIPVPSATFHTERLTSPHVRFTGVDSEKTMRLRER